MSAKILNFDPNRRVPPRHYTPIAMRGRILQMPARIAETSPELPSTSASSRSAAKSFAVEERKAAQKSGTQVSDVLAPWGPTWT